jgi:DNA-binding GntR family transcriptional regulator
MSDETTPETGWRISDAGATDFRELYAKPLHIDGVPLAEYIKRIVDERINELNAATVRFVEVTELMTPEEYRRLHAREISVGTPQADDHALNKFIHRVEKMGPVRLEPLDDGLYMIHLVVNDAKTDSRKD